MAVTLLVRSFLVLIAVLLVWQGDTLLIQNKISSSRYASTSTRLTASTSDSTSWQRYNQIAKVTLLSVVAFAQIANARPPGVDRPDLLPKEQNVPLIDAANFLSKGQEKKMINDINELQKLTGYKLRVLCQSYPNTPGLAIKNYWGVDDNTLVLVADKGEGFNKQGIPTNIMNLNIGKNVEDALPGQFWQRLVNKLGNQPYVKEVGADVAVQNAVQVLLNEIKCGDDGDVMYCNSIYYDMTDDCLTLIITLSFSTQPYC